MFVRLLVERVCVCALRLVSLLGFDRVCRGSLVHEFVLVFGSSVSAGVAAFQVVLHDDRRVYMLVLASRPVQLACRACC
jgi:hypothetical protein